jgi:glycosyltransferase involved in cell wall biosynthesis
VENLEMGGLERLAVDLALAQKAAGHCPAVYCLLGRGFFAGELETAGIPLLAFEKKKGISPRTVWRMARALRGFGADVVHTHNANVHHYGVAAARTAGVPVVVNTRHGLGVLHMKAKQERLFRATLPWTDAVVLVSEDSRDFFVRQRGIPEGKARVILNGIPVEKFAQRPSRPGSDRPRFRFGTVGRFVPAKEHRVLLEAFRIVREQYPQSELHLLGDGPLRASIENGIGELGLTDCVHLHGAGRDVPEFLSRLDVFVLSSVSEGLPVVVLEAMAAGLPIVSTRVGGVPEAAPEGVVAWYCPTHDSKALAEAMCAAAASDSLTQMGGSARRLARERFGIERMGGEYIRLFEDLLPRAAL